jgi:hypothetical protein
MHEQTSITAAAEDHIPWTAGKKNIIQQNSKLMMAWKESHVGISVCQLP